MVFVYLYFLFFSIVNILYDTVRQFIKIIVRKTSKAFSLSIIRNDSLLPF